MRHTILHTATGGGPVYTILKIVCTSQPLQDWATPSQFSHQRLSSRCINGGLYYDMVPTLTKVMRKHGIKRLFVLAHPDIRFRINQMLKEVSSPSLARLHAVHARLHGAWLGVCMSRMAWHGMALPLNGPQCVHAWPDFQVDVAPAYIEPETPAMLELSESIRSPAKASLLLFVEQAIALHAVAFVGTLSSSATLIVAQERVAERRTASAELATGVDGRAEGVPAGRVEYMFRSKLLETDVRD